MSEENKSGGIWDAVRRILDGGLAIAQNRVELFAIELREEKCRLVEAIILASAAVALGMMTLTLLTLSIVVLAWDSAREATLITLTVLYLSGTVMAWRGLHTKLQRAVPFAGTVDELKKDRACLRSENSSG